MPSIIEPCLTNGWRSVPAALCFLTFSLSRALLSPCGPSGTKQNAMASLHATLRHCQPFCFFCCAHFTSWNATALRRGGVWVWSRTNLRWRSSTRSESRSLWFCSKQLVGITKRSKGRFLTEMQEGNWEKESSHIRRESLLSTKQKLLGRIVEKPAFSIVFLLWRSIPRRHLKQLILIIYNLFNFLDKENRQTKISHVLVSCVTATSRSPEIKIQRDSVSYMYHAMINAMWFFPMLENDLIGSLIVAVRIVN